MLLAQMAGRDEYRFGQPSGEHYVEVRSPQLALAVLQISTNAPALAQSGACGGMTVGQLKSLNGFVPFEADSLWNTDISSAPVDSNSANIINYIGSTVTLHPDFGSGTYAGQSIGIPYQIVAGTQVKVTCEPGCLRRRK